MKDIIKGEVADLGIGYEVKIEDAKLKVSAIADFGKMLELAESKLPEGSLKPFEVMALELVKQGLKAL